MDTKPKKKTYSDYEIDLREFILILWKKKILVFLITLVFTLTGYIYTHLTPKYYQTTITVRDAQIEQFSEYISIIYSNQKYFSQFYYIKEQTFLSSFKERFKSNLLKSDNLLDFAEQNEKLDEFKSYLKANNVKITDYFQKKIKLEIGGNANQYTLTFLEPFPGNEFLNDYVIYAKQIEENTIKNLLTQTIKDSIEIYDLNIEIARELNIKNPVNQTFVRQNSELFVGSEILTLQRLNLQKDLNKIKNLTLNYNPIVGQDLLPTHKQKKYLHTTLFSIVGFFFSLVIILFKPHNKKKFF